MTFLLWLVPFVFVCLLLRALAMALAFRWSAGRWPASGKDWMQLWAILK